MESGRPSCCSDLKEVNEAKVANILAYLDSAVAANASASYSGIPLTVSALHNNTAGMASAAHSLPSSIAQGEPSHLRSPPIPTAATATSAVVTYANLPVDCAQATYVGIKKKIESLKFEKEELISENAELRARLDAFKARDASRRSEAREAVQGELRELRAELESVRNRSGLQMKKLTEEREKLERSVDAMASQLRREMLHREEDRQKLEAAHAAAINALKGKWQAQEKAAREKWKLAEAKRIKETTLQSLEPDIVLLLNRHKMEKARLREEYENELRQRDEAIAAKDASVEELRVRLQRDTEATMSREQLNFQTRLQEETERVRRQLEDERRAEKAKRDQMESFFEEEKTAMRREINRLGREVMELRSTQTVEQAAFHEAVAKEVSRITGQSTDMLTSLKEKLMLEFSCREKEAAQQNEQYLRSKEEELRRRCELERDAAIEKVVQKLESEHVQAMASSRGNDGLLRERYGQLSRDNERLRVELELAREQLEAAIAAKQNSEQKIASLREVSDLSSERIKAIEDRVRTQFNAKISILDDVWQGRLSELESAHAKEMCGAQLRIEALSRDVEIERRHMEQEQRSAEQRHHAELQQINERVLVAVTQKDSALQSQAEQILALKEALEVRNRELERHRSLLQ